MPLYTPNEYLNERIPITSNAQTPPTPKIPSPVDLDRDWEIIVHGWRVGFGESDVIRALATRRNELFNARKVTEWSGFEFELRRTGNELY